MSSEPTRAYLNDHLAGAAFGVDLVTKMRSDNVGSEFGLVLAGLERDIRQDRAVLQQVVETLGPKSDRIKQASGWTTEKLSRIIFSYRVTGSNDLSRLMQAEALSLGIEGKLAGWRALKELAVADLGVDLEALIARAADQRRRLEPFRIAAAKRAFESRHEESHVASRVRSDAGRFSRRTPTRHARAILSMVTRRASEAFDGSNQRGRIAPTPPAPTAQRTSPSDD